MPYLAPATAQTAQADLRRYLEAIGLDRPQVSAAQRAAITSARRKQEHTHHCARVGGGDAEAGRRILADRKRAQQAGSKRLHAARMTQAMPSWADREAIAAIYVEAQRLTRETGIPHEVDHIEPLLGKNASGLHVHYNLRVITRTENRRKSNRRA